MKNNKTKYSNYTTTPINYTIIPRGVREPFTELVMAYGFCHQKISEFETLMDEGGYLHYS